MFCALPRPSSRIACLWRQTFEELDATGMIRCIMSAALRKKVDETYQLSSRKGGGTLRVEVWVDASGRVARFNLAYVNRALFQRDNGRVLGYDNAHGRWHRHHYGKVTVVKKSSFAEIEAIFQKQWTAIAKEMNHGHGQDQG
jgi:hypothetical protein